jgi:hypothetical protein
MMALKRNNLPRYKRIAEFANKKSGVNPEMTVQDFLLKKKIRWEFLQKYGQKGAG